MQTRILLSAALAAQAALAGVLLIANGAADQAPAMAALLRFPSAQVSKVVISDGASSTTLEKSEDRWQLPALADLPANATRLTTLLQTLEGLQTRWPVVSSASGRERFEVSDEKFQRRLELFEGEELRGTYFFGTSPGFKQTHARRADEDEVYALSFNNVDLPADSNDWLDKGLLKVAEPTSIEGSDFSLVKSADVWSLAATDPSATGELDNAKVVSLVSALQNLQVLRLSEGAAPAGETRTLIVSDGSTRWTYEFTQASGQQYVRRSDRPQVFTVSSLDYDRTAGIVLADLLAQPSESSAADEAAVPSQNASPAPAE